VRVPRAREADAIVRVERHGGRVRELAKAVGIHLGSVSWWMTRAEARRVEDEALAGRCEELGRRLAQPRPTVERKRVKQ
jgi:transposase